MDKDLDQIIDNWLDGLEWENDEAEQLTLFQYNHDNTTNELTGPERSGKLKVAMRIVIGVILMSDPMITLMQVGETFNRNCSTIIYNRDQFYDQNGIDRELTSKVKMVTYLFLK